MLTLYYTPDTCALATHIVLEEVGANYILKHVDFARGEQKSNKYLSINPKARVPALVTPHGVLTETPAMMVYIAQCYPEAGLVPTDNTWKFAQLQSVNSYLCSTLHVAHAHRMRGSRWSNNDAAIAAMKQYAPTAVAESFRYVESSLIQEPWVLGSQYSIADVYLFTLSQWMESDGVDVKMYPRVIEHRARTLARPAVTAAIDAELKKQSD